MKSRKYRKMQIMAGLIMVGIISGCQPDGMSTNTSQMNSPLHYFAVGIEQNGKKIPIRNHQVVLEKSPFSLLIAFASPDAVLLNVSTNSQSFITAGNAPAKGAIKCFMGKPVSEGLFNREQSVILSDKTYHILQCYSPKIHKFDKIFPHEDAWIGRRTISQVKRGGNSDGVKIKNIPENEMFFVFLKTEWNSNHSARIEKQRDRLRIIFR